MHSIAQTAKRKGIDIVGTGDFLHPGWLAELKRDLEEAEPGLYEVRRQKGEGKSSTRFLLSTEVSCIYSRGGKVRRVHHLVFVPSFRAVDAIVAELRARGANLASDGRPIIGLDSEELLKIVLASDEDALLIPAHAWTPWFAVFGSKSGFDTLEECFGSLGDKVVAIETGLSSNPPMNWRVSALDRVALISNSDAHSLPNIGREANVLELESLSYENVADAIRKSSPGKLAHSLSQVEGLPKNRIASTIEFYPEEGMYHYDGHRACDVRLTPEETKRHHGKCPRCHLPVTIGVLNRVAVLADRPADFRPAGAPDFFSLVGLDKIIAESFDMVSRTSKHVREEYERIVSACGNELTALMETPYDELARVTNTMVVEGIRRVREGKLSIEPGFDGQYGRVTIFSDHDRVQRAGGMQSSINFPAGK